MLISKKTFYGIIAALISVFLFNGCTAKQEKISTGAKAQNIILFIGDGMGEQHRFAAKLLSVGNKGSLEMDNMPVKGYSNTRSASSTVTDSAAAATSMATGVKTNNKVIGMNTKFIPIETVLEKAHKMGKSVGIVTTTQVTHATPAGFSAHVKNRDDMTEIAKQMAEKNIDVILGGGEDEFLPEAKTGCYPENGERTDGLDLIELFIEKDYKYICNYDSFIKVNPELTKKIVGLFSDEGMLRPYSPSLKEMTAKAIAILSKNKKGFFLMVEGGQIDWASHSNSTMNAINDTVELDQAVMEAKAFANEKKDTLVIVTADHETGGLKVNLKKGLIAHKFEKIAGAGGKEFYVKWTTKNHTDQDVPVTAMGPSSELLTGNYPNTHIYDVMQNAFNTN